MMQFEPHIPSNRSSLEPYREQITAMRSQNWPHLKIAQWLSDNHKLIIHQESVRRFCNSRKIQKPSLKNRTLQTTKSKPVKTATIKKPTKEKFIYEPAPIDIHKK